jgi:hypothetical protein
MELERIRIIGMTIEPVSLMGMVMEPEAILTALAILFGWGIGSIGWVWNLSKKHTILVMEHEALKADSARNAAHITAVDNESKARDAAVQVSLDEVKSMMREERHQMGRMASKIDLLISVLVQRQDSTVDLSQIMAILEKGDSK